MTNDTTDLHSQAQSILSSIFFRILLDDSNLDFETFEDGVISTLHKLATSAIGEALEKYDKVLCSNLPEGYRIHDRRERMLATEIGDLSFHWRRVKGPAGCSIPLGDALNLAWGTRISPGASRFLLEAGAEVSYLRAAKLLARKGGLKGERFICDGDNAQLWASL